MPDDTKTIRPPEGPEQSKDWMTTWTTLLDGHQKAMQQWLQTVQSVSDELLTIAATRSQLAMEGWSMLAGCREPEELIDWNRRMSAKATDHCAGEIARLSDMTMRMALLQPAIAGRP